MLKLKVDGMTCGHCAQSVRKAVAALPHVDSVSVDLKTGEVTIEGAPDRGAVLQAVGAAGYDIRAAA